MIERAIFEYLINSLWQVPLLAFATWLLLRAARPTLRVQHALWFAALALAVLIPMRGIDLDPAPAIHDSVRYEPAISLATIAQPMPPPESRIHALLALRIHPLQLSDRTIDWLVGLYGVSFAFSLARLLHSWIATRKLVASAIEHPLTTLETSLLNACAQRLQLDAKRLPEIRFLPGAISPMVVGILHPMLLLPEKFRHGNDLAFDDRRLTAILSHELAHIRRRDYLANLATRVVALPIAYHPATLALQRRIRQTREMICDAHAADVFGSPSTYARSLLALAAHLLPQPSHVEAVSLFANARNTLEERIMKLTETTLPIHRTLRAVRIAAGTITLVAATATAATLHVKPATPVVSIAHNAQPSQDTPALPQVAAPAPSPAPSPTPKPHPRITVNGEQRQLTPAEKAQLDKELAEAHEQMEKATAQFSNGEFQKNLAESMKSINSEDFKKQMAEMQVQMQKINSPEFRKQIADAQASANSPELKLQMKDLKLKFDSPEFHKQMADAQAAANSPELKLQMKELKLKFDSPEFRKQMEEAKLISRQSAIEWRASNVEAHQQLDEARAAIAEARKQSNDAKVQQQLDEAQRRIDAATKKF